MRIIELVIHGTESGKQIKIRFNPERVFAGGTLSGLVSFSTMIPRVVAAAPTLGNKSKYASTLKGFLREEPFQGWFLSQ